MNPLTSAFQTLRLMRTWPLPEYSCKVRKTIPVYSREAPHGNISSNIETLAQN
jgi:hypothetical protein